MPTFPAQTDVSSGYYGSLAGVQEMLRPIIPLTSTTPVTTTDVTNALDSLGNALDLKLGAAGYVTPVVSAAAVLVLADCANRLVAADALERLIIARDPSAERVKVAEVWRKQANDTLALVWSGASVLPGAARSTASAPHDTPSVVSSASKFPSANTEELVEAYGEPFSGGPVAV